MVQSELSGTLSFAGPPHYSDVIPFHGHIVESFQIEFYGVQTGHIPTKNHMPDDGHLVDVIPQIATTSELQNKLLIDNPMRAFIGPVKLTKYKTIRGIPMALDKPYSDIPGTTIFDADMARIGFHINQFSMSLMKAENRERFKADERAYLDEWPMTEEQKQAVLDRDYNRMTSLGGNVYFLAKIFSTDGLSFQVAAGSMTEHVYRRIRSNDAKWQVS